MKYLLQNKRKSIRSLPTFKRRTSGFVQEADENMMDLCFYFPRIHTLKVFQPDGFLQDQGYDLPSSSFERKVLKSYGCFWEALKYVQHLEISTSSSNLWIILPQLQSSKRFLSSLKTFCLEIAPISLSISGRKPIQDFYFRLY